MESESGVGVGGVACFQLESGVGVVFSNLLESESGVGVGFSKLLESESGVGVVFLKLLESESGVGVGFSKLLESGVGVGILKNLPTPQPCGDKSQISYFLLCNYIDLFIPVAIPESDRVRLFNHAQSLQLAGDKSHTIWPGSVSQGSQLTADAQYSWIYEI